MYCKTRDIQSEAENHIKVLEELRDIIKSFTKVNYDEVKEKRIKALDFAIDFIKWGMK